MEMSTGRAKLTQNILRLMLASGVVLTLIACGGKSTAAPPAISTTLPTSTSIPSPTIIPISTLTDSVFSAMPKQIDPKARYVIYLHGKIVEDQGAQNPTDPRFGLYDYAGILNALAVDGNQVISEVRKANTDPVEYAGHVVEQINTLLNAGVPPENISVVGFSKGGAITILVASQLNNERVKYVILAGSCQVDSLEQDKSIVFHGQVLSIYEASDEYGQSCQEIADRSPQTLVFEEIRLDTGLAHGEFYLPRNEWLLPVLDWIRK
jgi:predicted esterase